VFNNYLKINVTKVFGTLGFMQTRRQIFFIYTSTKLKIAFDLTNRLKVYSVDFIAVNKGNLLSHVSDHTIIILSLISLDFLII